MRYYPGDIVTFTAQRSTVLNGERYKEGDQVSIRLKRFWDDEEGSGRGGPWGWGGYTSRFIKSLGEIRKLEN